MRDIATTEIIFDLMKEKNIKNFKGLAEKLSMKPSSFSHATKNLFTDKHSNRFAKNLCRVLGIKLSQFEKACKQEQKVFSNADDELAEDQIDYLELRSRNYGNEILAVTRRLNKGDNYTLVTCYTPIEYADFDLMGAIADAIKRGVRFYYFFPNNKGSRFDLIKPFLPPEAINYDIINQHKYPDYRKLLRTKYKLTDKKIDKCIKLVPCDDPILMNPFVKFVRVTKQNMEIATYNVFIEIRTGRDYRRRTNYWFPLPKVEADKINESLTEIFNNFKGGNK